MSIYYPIHEIESLADTAYGPCFATVELSDLWVITMTLGYQAGLTFRLRNGVCLCNPAEMSNVRFQLVTDLAYRLWEIYGGNDIKGAILFNLLTQPEAETLLAISSCPIITL